MPQPDAIQQALKRSALRLQPSAICAGAEIQHGCHLLQLRVLPLQLFQRHQSPFCATSGVSEMGEQSGALCFVESPQRCIRGGKGALHDCIRQAHHRTIFAKGYVGPKNHAERGDVRGALVRKRDLQLIGWRLQ